MSRVLVTGGAGFLGSHLCETLLERGDEVVAVDNLLTGSVDNVAHLEGQARFRFLHHDVVQPLDLPGPFDAVLHLASPASPRDYLEHPLETLAVGSVGTRNCLDLAATESARFLLASTSEVYGDPLVHPQPEDYWGNVNPIGRRSCYDEGKRCAETLFFDYYRQHRLNIRVARIFNTYGPRMHPKDGRVVSNFIMQALTGESITIYGDGSQTRSFCYVSDLVEGLTRFMDLRPDDPGPLNLGNPGEFTVLELAEMVLRLTNSPSRLVFEPLPEDDPKQRRPDISRAKSLLDWEPKVPLEDGLKETIQYFRALAA